MTSSGDVSDSPPPDEPLPRDEPLLEAPMPPTGGAPVADPVPGTGGGGPAPPRGGSPEKDPGDWTTGDEAMTGPRRSYLETLAREAGEQVSDGLTKAQASEMIDRLQDRTGRGH